jgi:hypothetical protein
MRGWSAHVINSRPLELGIKNEDDSFYSQDFVLLHLINDVHIVMPFKNVKWCGNIYIPLDLWNLI